MLTCGHELEFKNSKIIIELSTNNFNDEIVNVLKNSFKTGELECKTCKQLENAQIDKYYF